MTLKFEDSEYLRNEVGTLPFAPSYVDIDYNILDSFGVEGDEVQGVTAAWHFARAIFLLSDPVGGALFVAWAGDISVGHGLTTL